MRGVIATVVLATLLCAGCARSVAASSSVWGPYPDRDPRQLFETAVERVRARGYTVVDADVNAGHFAVRSNHPTRCGRAIFRFRFYRGGWVAADVANGGTPRCGEGDVEVPTAIFHEYTRLVAGLLESPTEDE